MWAMLGVYIQWLLNIAWPTNLLITKEAVEYIGESKEIYAMSILV